MFNYNQDDRFSLQQVIDSPWITSQGERSDQKIKADLIEKLK